MSARKGYLYWLNGAKTTHTRKARLARTLELVAQNISSRLQDYIVKRREIRKTQIKSTGSKTSRK